MESFSDIVLPVSDQEGKVSLGGSFLGQPYVILGIVVRPFSAQLRV